MKYQKTDEVVFIIGSEEFNGKIVEVDKRDETYLIEEDETQDRYWCRESEILRKTSSVKVEAAEEELDADHKSQVTEIITTSMDFDADHKLKVIEVIMGSTVLPSRIKLDVITYCTAAWMEAK